MSLVPCRAMCCVTCSANVVTQKLPLYRSAPHLSMAAEEDYHIYKVPRPVRSQSFPTGTPTPPLPIQVPEQTLYTQNQLYSAQLSTIPSSAPPYLPRRNTTAIGDLDSSTLPSLPPFPPLPPLPSTTTPQETASGSSPSKKRWKNSLPHFGSFKEKTRKADYGPQHQSNRQECVPSSTSEVSEQPPPGAILTLGKLAQNHPHSFPFQVKVLQSYSFQASQQAITELEVYQLLLVKQQQFVSMQDRLGMSYSIPLNSAVQFGYVNSSDRKSSPHNLAYKSYTKVADILALGETEMPRIMCAQQTHKGQNGKCSVDENEILLILRARKSKLSGRKYLKVYSFSTKSRKSLYPDCVGHFTTNPAHLRLWLTEMVNVHASIFPCQAVIYLERRFTSSLNSFPSTLLQADSYVTLTGLSIHTSIVASRATHPATQPALLDMPMTGLLNNLQVEVTPPLNSEALQTAARGAYEGLDISSLQSLDDSISERAHTTKCLFYTILRRGSEHVGVNLLPPSCIKNTKQSDWSLPCDATKIFTDSEHDSDSDIEHYEKISDWVGAESPSAEGSGPNTPLLHSTSQTSETPTFSIGSQSYHLPPLSSASPSHSSGFHSLSAANRLPPIIPNSLFHPIPSPPLVGDHADDDYEMMESPTPPSLPDHHPFRELPPQNGEGFVDVPGLRRAVRMLEGRVVPLERKVAEHQQLQALVRTLSLRITKLEKQLIPQSQSSANSRMASVREANISYLCSLNPSQVKHCIQSHSQASSCNASSMPKTTNNVLASIVYEPDSWTIIIHRCWSCWMPWISPTTNEPSTTWVCRGNS